MPPMVRPVDIDTDGAGNTVTAAPKKHGALFEQLNCGKLGLSIDMKSEKVGWVFLSCFLKKYIERTTHICSIPLLYYANVFASFVLRHLQIKLIIIKKIIH